MNNPFSQRPLHNTTFAFAPASAPRFSLASRCVMSWYHELSLTAELLLHAKIKYSASCENGVLDPAHTNTER
jgi:hypothetical protein